MITFEYKMPVLQIASKELVYTDDRIAQGADRAQVEGAYSGKVWNLVFNQDSKFSTIDYDVSKEVVIVSNEAQ